MIKTMQPWKGMVEGTGQIETELFVLHRYLGFTSLPRERVVVLWGQFDIFRSKGDIWNLCKH